MSLPSVHIVLDEVRRRLDFQFELSNSLDFKASIALGTSGLTFALFLAALPLAQPHLSNLLHSPADELTASILIVASFSVLFASTVLSIVVLWIKKYDRPPSLDRLRNHYIAEPVDDTELALIDTFVQSIAVNEKTLKWQANLVKIATALLVGGLLIFMCLLCWFTFVFFKAPPA